MPDSAAFGLYHLSLTYRLGDCGLLVAEELPAHKVAVRGEGALYRRLARLADAEDAALVAAASRYGPLGPTRGLAVADQPAYLWALNGTVPARTSATSACSAPGSATAARPRSPAASRQSPTPWP